KSWARLGCNLMIWDYWNMGGNAYFMPPRPEVIIDALQLDYKLFRKFGVKSMFIEAEKDLMTPQNFIDLEYFVAYQLMIDPERDLEQLIDVYMKNYYGPAAPLMTKYLQSLREGVRKHKNPQRTYLTTNWEYMTPQFMLNTYRLLHDAEKMVKSNPILRRRVREEMISPLWTTIYYRSGYEPFFKKNDVNFDHLINECHEIVSEYIAKDNPRNLEKLKIDFEAAFRPMITKLSTPERFKAIPAKDVKVFGQIHARRSGRKVEDSDSPTGLTVRSRLDDDSLHGVDAKISNFPCTAFGVSNYENDIGGQQIKITEIPADEKYHWYRISDVIIGSRTVFWGHYWYISYDLSMAYTPNSPAEKNTYDVWFSAKFTGPAYVPDSKKENAIFVDQVVMVRSKTEKGKLLLRINAKDDTSPFDREVLVSDNGRGGVKAYQAGRLNLLSTQKFKINPDKYYITSMWVKTVGSQPSFAYLGIAPFNAENQYIRAKYVDVVQGSLTELAEPAKMGDMSIKVKNASKWLTDRVRAAAFNAREDCSDLPNMDVSESIKSIEKHDGLWEITFHKPLTKEYSASTKVRQHNMAGYVYTKVGMVPTKWTLWKSRKIKGSQLRRGTDGRVVLLLNHGKAGQGNKILFNDLMVEEFD
ncbi:MAG: DUF4838 domain-containing protein, partial [Victivallaceae bacterium]|nr:DUF4838 domain-containing protein [Victivallaceae bacterium]